MEKLSDRVGLFDLWAVFFPGSIGILELLLCLGIIWSFCRDCSIITAFEKILSVNISGWIVLIFISFLLGIVFQEIGRWLCKVFKSPTASIGFLDPKNGVFTEKEIDSLRAFFIKYGWDGKSEAESKTIFRRINVEALERGVAERYVKLSVIQNMSLSLSVAMLLGAIMALILLVFGIANRSGYVSFVMATFFVICSFLSILFFRRSKRFNRYWVRNLVYAMSEKKRWTEDEHAKRC